ncbi:MAG: hypothetical protein K2N82_08620 [Lachnospiraceae bacterium]|nr:hypothetical protein [Lachnospiraceae bacterium]
MSFRSRITSNKFGTDASDENRLFYSKYQKDGNLSDFWKRNLGNLVNCKSLKEVWDLTGEYKKIEPDCREGVRTQLERMKELCKERNRLYEKQNDLKGQKQKIEKSLER